MLSYLPATTDSITVCIRKYEPDLAFFLATLCYQAKILYKLPSFFTVPVFPEEYRFVTSLQSSLTGLQTGYGYILESSKNIYIIFRGSASVADLYQDANVFLTPFSLVPNGGSVHNGFYSIYTSNAMAPLSLRDKVIQTLHQLDPSKQLYITGFSLGGAVATLCTLDIAVNTGFTRPISYTFASPRVGNKTFVTKFNQTITQNFRVVNAYDIVPTLPPAIFGYGYYHVKSKIELIRDTGNKRENHNLRKAYIPALYSVASRFRTEVCSKNPPSFCPDTITQRPHL